ncbi:MAG: N-acetylneuraminate synthase family protein [Pontimonas sp.]|nr:N-acetylneuraminate synthase family protein [Pontimonas sp.]
MSLGSNNPLIARRGFTVIAEIGVNHNGDLGLAKEMMDAALTAGADYVKFQSFIPERFVARNTPKAQYQRGSDGVGRSHFEMLEALSLSFDQQAELFAYGEKIGIPFISTPYELESLRFLVRLGVPVIKTASADIIDWRLHEAIAATSIPVLISTGGSTSEEITRALEHYRRANAEHVALMHAVSSYPSPMSALNISTIPLLRQTYGVLVGYSDHSENPIHAATLAFAAGSRIFERHFTTDKSLPGPDQAASSDPEELSLLVASLEQAVLGWGAPRVGPLSEERDFLLTSRKSIHVKLALPAGSILRDSDMIFLRPGNGISPLRAEEFTGRTTLVNLDAGQILEANHVS